MSRRLAYYTQQEIDAHYTRRARAAFVLAKAKLQPSIITIFLGGHVIARIPYLPINPDTVERRLTKQGVLVSRVGRECDEHGDWLVISMRLGEGERERAG